MAVAMRDGTQLQDWWGLLGGPSAAVGAYTWAHRWGDPWLASFADSTAMLDGGAPARWTAQGMQDDPESLFTLARLAGWDYAAAVTPEGPTPARVEAQGGGAGLSNYCEAIPRPLRYLVAPCVGEELGRRAAGTPTAQALGPLLVLILAIVALVLVFK